MPTFRREDWMDDGTGGESGERDGREKVSGAEDGGAPCRSK